MILPKVKIIDYNEQKKSVQNFGKVADNEYSGRYMIKVIVSDSADFNFASDIKPEWEMWSGIDDSYSQVTKDLEAIELNAWKGNFKIVNTGVIELFENHTAYKVGGRFRNLEFVNVLFRVTLYFRDKKGSLHFGIWQIKFNGVKEPVSEWGEIVSRGEIELIKNDFDEDGDVVPDDCKELMEQIDELEKENDKLKIDMSALTLENEALKIVNEKGKMVDKNSLSFWVSGKNILFKIFDSWKEKPKGLKIALNVVDSLGFIIWNPLTAIILWFILIKG
jgi:hypothetical protein